MSHFATADELEDDFFAEQLGRFRAWAEPLRARHPGVLLHTANSAATLRDPASHYDLVRTGIAIYGMDPFGEDPAARGLEPALTLRSYVAEVKPMRAGRERRLRAALRRRGCVGIATVPVGYGDGWRRALSGAHGLVGGRRVPIAGTVSMDNVTLDLGAGGRRQVGDEVVLIGAQGDERILAEEVAARLGTINYEVTCALTPRVPREPPRPVSGRARRRRGGGQQALEHGAAIVARRARRRAAWVVGGVVRDRLLGARRRAARPRPGRRRRPRVGGAART